jgi:hypothetical protein
MDKTGSVNRFFQEHHRVPGSANRAYQKLYMLAAQNMPNSNNCYLFSFRKAVVDFNAA